MDLIRKGLDRLLPRMTLEKIKRMAQSGIDEVNGCDSDDSRIEVAGKYLDRIVRKARDREVREIAESALTISEEAPESAKIAGYRAALAGLAKMNTAGEVDKALLSICATAIDSAPKDSDKVAAAQPFMTLLAKEAHDSSMKHLAAAACNFQKYDWNAAVVSGYRAAISAIITPLSGSLEQILIAAGDNAFNGIKEQQGQGTDIARAFGTEVGKVTADPRMKSLAHILETMDYRDDGSTAACIEAYKALTGTAGESVSSALVKAAQNAINNATSERDKQGAAWPFIEEVATAGEDPTMREVALAVSRKNSSLHRYSCGSLVIATAVMGAIMHPQAAPAEHIITALAKKSLESMKDAGFWSYSLRQEKAGVALGFLRGLAAISKSEGVRSVAEAAHLLNETYADSAKLAGFEAALDAISGDLRASPREMLLRAASGAMKGEQENEDKVKAVKPFLKQLEKVSSDGNEKRIAHAVGIMKETYTHYEEALCIAAAIEAITKGTQGPPDRVLAEVARDAMRERPDVQGPLSGRIRYGAAKPFLQEISATSKDPVTKSLAGAAVRMIESGYYDPIYSKIIDAILKPPGGSIEEILCATASKCLQEAGWYRIHHDIGKSFLQEIAATTGDQNVRYIAETAGNFNTNMFLTSNQFSEAISCATTIDVIPKLLKSPAQPLDRTLASIGIAAMSTWDQVKQYADQQGQALSGDLVTEEKGFVAKHYLGKIAGVSKDPGIQSVAGVACSLRDNYTFRKELACAYDAALNAVSNYKGEPPEAIIIGIAGDIAKRGDLGTVGKVEVIPQLMKEASKAAGDPVVKALSSAAGDDDGYVSYDSKMAVFEAAMEALSVPRGTTPVPVILARAGLKAMEKGITYPAEAGAAFLRIISHSTTNEDSKKLMKPYLDSPYSLRNEDAAAGLKKLLTSIVELHSAMEELKNYEKGENSSAIVSEDDFVNIGGVKLERNEKNAPHKESVAAIQSLFVEEMRKKAKLESLQSQ